MGFPGGRDGRPRGRAGGQIPASPVHTREPGTGTAGYRVPPGASPWPGSRHGAGAETMADGPGAGLPPSGPAVPGARSGGSTRARPVRAADPANPSHLARRGPIRGFPPTPGQPDPVYPPGQFSAWNRRSVRAAWLGLARPGTAADADAEPGYSALAVSDPSADMTATQTWAAIEDDQRSGRWPPAGVHRDWGSHAEDSGPVPAGKPKPALDRHTGPAPDWSSRAVPGQSPEAGPDQSPSGAAVIPATALAGAPAGAASGPGTGHRARPSAPGELAGPPARGHRATARNAPPAAQGRGRAPGQGRRRQPGDAPRQAAASGARAASSASQAAGARRAARPRARGNIMMAGLLLSPVVVVMLVVAGYVYVNNRHSPSPARTAAPSHPAVISTTPGPALGPWKYIGTRSQDSQPLSAAELFPARFSAGGITGVRTVTRSGNKCQRALIGRALRAAVQKAGCTQVIRASYLSSSKKFMATIGVLNLADARSAQRVGRVTGASEFIRQLPAAHGPTRRLAQGTGLEEADVMGHYLILTWAEFTNLHKPSGKKQLAELTAFSKDLITGTANVSLTSRMVTGKPRVP